MSTAYLSVGSFRDVYRQPTLTTAATISAMEVSELKQHLRIDIDDEDQLLQAYIDAATAFVERDAEIALLTQTWALRLDCFPPWTIELRRPPVASVSSVVYLASDGTSTTLAASTYRLDAYSRPPRLTPAYNEVWPDTYPVTNAVTITFVAGETSRATIPAAAKQAIRLLCGHWYRNRETVVSTGAVPQELTLAYGACIDRLIWAGGV